jgi:hypothetical protein
MINSITVKIVHIFLSKKLKETADQIEKIALKARNAQMRIIQIKKTSHVICWEMSLSCIKQIFTGTARQLLQPVSQTQAF